MRVQVETLKGLVEKKDGNIVRSEKVIQKLRKRKPGSAGRLRRDGGRPLRCGGSCHHWAKLLRNGLEM